MKTLDPSLDAQLAEIYTAFEPLSYERIYARVILLNEVPIANAYAAAYGLSDAGGKSGFSFGLHQLDLRSNKQEASEHLLAILDNSDAAGGDELRASLRVFINESIVGTQASEHPEIKADSRFASVHALLDAKFSRSYLKVEFLCHVVQEIAGFNKWLDENIVDTGQMAFLRRPEVFVYMLDLRNQNGEAKFKGLLEFVLGRRAEVDTDGFLVKQMELRLYDPIRGKRLSVSPYFSSLLEYRLVTNYANKNPWDIVRRTSQLIAEVGADNIELCDLDRQFIARAPALLSSRVVGHLVHTSQMAGEAAALKSARKYHLSLDRMLRQPDSIWKSFDDAMPGWNRFRLTAQSASKACPGFVTPEPLVPSCLGSK